MGFFFSKSKKDDSPKNKNAEISDRDKAVLELKRQRDRLKKYKSSLSILISKEVKLAKEYLANNDKKKAVYILKKKRYQERMIEKTEGQMNNIETLIMEIDSAVRDKALFESMKMGKECLDALHAEMDIDDLNDLMDDCEEGLRRRDELDSILSRNLTGEELELLDSDVDELLANMMDELEEAPEANSNVVEETEEAKLTEDVANLPTTTNTDTVDTAKASRKTVATKTKKDRDVILS